MSNNLEIKKQVVSDITSKLQNAQSMVIVNYNGLTVEQVTALRAQFRAAGVDYCVLKNTLVRRALDDMGITGLDEVLNGPSAFAFGMQDAVSPAKILKDFVAKTKTEAISVKAGLLGKEVMNAKQIEALADIPSREVLLARMMGCMKNSVSGFVRVIDAIAKKEAGADAPAEG